MPGVRMMMKVLVPILLLLVAAYVAFPEHRATLAWLGPLLLLMLVCPLAMMLMGGSGDEEKKDHGRDKR